MKTNNVLLITTLMFCPTLLGMSTQQHERAQQLYSLHAACVQARTEQEINTVFLCINILRAGLNETVDLRLLASIEQQANNTAAYIALPIDDKIKLLENMLLQHPSAIQITPCIAEAKRLRQELINITDAMYQIQHLLLDRLSTVERQASNLQVPSQCIVENKEEEQPWSWRDAYAAFYDPEAAAQQCDQEREDQQILAEYLLNYTEE